MKSDNFWGWLGVLVFFVIIPFWDRFTKDDKTPTKEKTESVRRPVQQPVRRPVQQPVRRPVQQPVQRPVQQPVQRPVQQPVRQSVQRPSSSSNYSSGNYSSSSQSCRGGRKENDMFMTMLASPQAKLDDYIVGGMNVNNTSLQDREIYKNNDKVRKAYQNPNGTFNDDAFNRDYNRAREIYNNLSSKSADQILKDQVTYHRSNPFAPAEKKRQGPEYQEIKESNPNGQISNMIELGRTESSK